MSALTAPLLETPTHPAGHISVSPRRHIGARVNALAGRPLDRLWSDFTFPTFVHEDELAAVAVTVVR
nr:hypothetical protein [Kibdelosporangium sp. MJ126-NF4]CTQ95956.1 hypothetical protein [Kibdelosporangium sp. MJ126-NF4]